MLDFGEAGKAESSRLARKMEVEFHIRNRRNKLLGLWAAAQLKLEGDGADAYARGVVGFAVQKPGDGALIERIREDLRGAGVELSDETIGAELKRVSELAAMEFGVERKPARAA